MKEQRRMASTTLRSTVSISKESSLPQLLRTKSVLTEKWATAIGCDCLASTVRRWRTEPNRALLQPSRDQRIYMQSMRVPTLQEVSSLPLPKPAPFHILHEHCPDCLAENCSQRTHGQAAPSPSTQLKGDQVTTLTSDGKANVQDCWKGHDPELRTWMLKSTAGGNTFNYLQI